MADLLARRPALSQAPSCTTRRASWSRRHRRPTTRPARRRRAPRRRPSSGRSSARSAASSRARGTSSPSSGSRCRVRPPRPARCRPFQGPVLTVVLLPLRRRGPRDGALRRVQGVADERRREPPGDAGAARVGLDHADRDWLHAGRPWRPQADGRRLARRPGRWAIPPLAPCGREPERLPAALPAAAAAAAGCARAAHDLRQRAGPERASAGAGADPVPVAPARRAGRSPSAAAAASSCGRHSPARSAVGAPAAVPPVALALPPSLPLVVPSLSSPSSPPCCHPPFATPALPSHPLYLVSLARNRPRLSIAMNSRPSQQSQSRGGERERGGCPSKQVHAAEGSRRPLPLSASRRRSIAACRPGRCPRASCRRTD